MMFILMEAFRYISLIYINKKEQISKVTLYGSLDGFFVILITLIFEGISFFENFFIAVVTIAYFILFLSKYFQSRMKKKSNDGKILKYMQLIDNDEEVQRNTSTSQLHPHTFFYKSEKTMSVFSREKSISKKSIFLPEKFKFSQKSIAFIIDSDSEPDNQGFVRITSVRTKPSMPKVGFQRTRTLSG